MSTQPRKIYLVYITDPDVDYRGIEIASSYNLSEAGRQYLLNEDDTYSLKHGKLIELATNQQ